MKIPGRIREKVVQPVQNIGTLALAAFMTALLALFVALTRGA